MTYNSEKKKLYNYNPIVNLLEQMLLQTLTWFCDNHKHPNFKLPVEFRESTIILYLKSTS